MLSLDHHLFRDVNSLSRHTSWAHGFMGAYANWAGLVVLAGLVVACWLWSRRQGSVESVVTCVLAGLSGVIVLGINHFVSQGVARARPCRALHHVVVILSCASDYSFPSDHAVIAGGLATGLLFFSRKVGLLAWALALFLAFARVYAGVHYPADVIGGLLLGAAIAVAVWLLLRRPALSVAMRAIRTPLRSLIAAGTPVQT